MEKSVLTVEIPFFLVGGEVFYAKVVLEDGGVWMSKNHISELFNKDMRYISRIINNMFIERELPKDMHVKRWYLNREYIRTKFYSLDVVINVGGKVKSGVGQKFRQWLSTLAKVEIKV